MQRFLRTLSTGILFALFGGLLLTLGLIFEKSSNTSRGLEFGSQPNTTLEQVDIEPPPTQTTAIPSATDQISVLQYALASTNKPAIPNSDSLPYELSYFWLRFGPDMKQVGTPVPLELPKSLDFNPVQVWPSPSGRFVVFMKPAMPGGVPYIFNRETGEVHAGLDQYGGGKFYGWHPDGVRFLYWVDVEQVGVQLVNANTLETRKLAVPTGPLQGAEISPDGKTVAYIDDDPSKTDQPTKALCLVSADGGDAKSVATVGLSAYMKPAAFSPDGKRLIYSGDCEPTQNRKQEIAASSLCVFNIEKSTAQRITNPQVGDDHKWSPDGKTFLATGLAAGEKPCEVKQPDLPFEEQLVDPCIFAGYSILQVDPDTGEGKELARGIRPVWSPDGKAIAFLSNQSSVPEVWMLDVASGTTTQISSDGQPKSLGNMIWLYEAVK